MASNPISDVLNSLHVASIGKQKNNAAYGVGMEVPGGNSGPGGGLNGVVGNYGGSGSSNPPPGQITIGGQSAGDAANSIFNDPAFMALRNQLSAQGISDAAHLRGALQQYLIQFGGVPNNLPGEVVQNSGLDAAGTQALADQNPFSFLKQLQQRYIDQKMATQNQLAARGALSSGEAGYRLGQLGQQNSLDEYNGTNTLLGNVDSLYSQYIQGQQNAANQLAQGALTAENTAAANGSGGGGGTGTAKFDPATGTWVDSNGNHYTQDGQPIVLPPAPGTPAPPSNQGAPAPGMAPVNVYDPNLTYRPGTTNTGY